MMWVPFEVRILLSNGSCTNSNDQVNSQCDVSECALVPVLALRKTLTNAFSNTSLRL